MSTDSDVTSIPPTGPAGPDDVTAPTAGLSSGPGHDSDRPTAEEITDLADRITVLATALASKEADLLDLVAKFDAADGFAHYDGIVSTAHWLAWQCGIADGTAREHVRVARALPDMPHTRKLFRQGSLSYSKVRELTRLVGEVEEKEMADFALLTTASQLARTVRAFRMPPGTRLPQELEHELRWHTTPNDMERLTVTLPREEAAKVKAALEAALQHLLHDRSDDGTDADQPQDADQPPNEALTKKPPHQASAHAEQASEQESHTEKPRQPTSEPTAKVTDAERVQALVDIANSYLDHRDHRPADDHTLVMVHVAVEQLDPAAALATAPPRPDVPAGTSPPPAAAATTPSEAGAPSPRTAARPTSYVPAGTSAVSPDLVDELRRQTCHIPNVGAISAATAQRLACSDRVQGIIHDTTGHILNLGRTRRLVSPAQRRALTARDHQTCQFPGCRQHHRLDAHHIIPWAAGGPTDLDNLILVCRRHHTLIHESGLSIHRSTIPLPGHRFRFERADGSAVRPAPPSSDANWQWHHDLMSEIGPGFRRRGSSPVSPALDESGPASGTGGAPLPPLPKDLTTPPGDIRTRGGGEGFSLHECVRVLHELRLPNDPDDTMPTAA